MLQTLLTELPPGMPEVHRPSLHLHDADGRTALDMAIASQQWPCVGLLIAAGALQVRQPSLHFPDEGPFWLAAILVCNVIHRY